MKQKIKNYEYKLKRSERKRWKNKDKKDWIHRVYQDQKQAKTQKPHRCGDWFFKSNKSKAFDFAIYMKVDFAVFAVLCVHKRER